MDSDDQEPLPPMDLDAEGAVLGGLLSGEVMVDQLPGLDPNHFYSHSNRIVFKAVLFLERRGEPWDTVVLASLLHDKGLLSSVGGTAYIATLAMMQPSVTEGTARQHAHRIVYLWGWRRCRAALAKAAALIRTERPHLVFAKLQEDLDAAGYQLRSRSTGMQGHGSPDVRDESSRGDATGVPRMLPKADSGAVSPSASEAAAKSATRRQEPDPRRHPQSSTRLQGVSAATRADVRGPIP